MKFYRQIKEPLSLNVTPLIDVVFLLLIFFVTSSSFMTDTALDIMLPSMQVSNQVSTQNTIKISVTSEGTFYVNDRLLLDNKTTSLLHALSGIQSFNENTVILIAADANAPYRAVIQAMDAAGKLGYEKIQLLGDKSDEYGHIRS